MPDINTYLTFNGNCGDAMRFYEKTLGGKLDVMTMGESPIAAQTPPEAKNRVMHARLKFDGGMLMASDDQPGAKSTGMHGFSVSLIYKTADEARRVFDALAKGGNVTMPFQKVFWSEGFGMVTDRFGTPWMLNGGMQAM
jgi:PhnB protein